MADTNPKAGDAGGNTIVALDETTRAWAKRLLPLLNGQHVADATTAQPLPAGAPAQFAKAHTTPGNPGLSPPPPPPTIDNLVKAIADNDVPTVYRIVQAYAQAPWEMDKQAANGETPLTQAVKATHNNNFRFVDLLIHKGVSPDVRERDGETPLMIAARRNDELILDFLLIKKASIDDQDLQNRTALFLAVANGSAKAVARLLQNKPLPNVDLPADGERTPLIEAASQGDYKSVELLQGAKAKLDLKDRDKKTALMIAAANGHSKVVKFLLDKNANPHFGDESGGTALMNAAETGNPEIANYLLTGSRKVAVNAQNAKDETALMFAVQSKEERIKWNDSDDEKAKKTKENERRNKARTQLVKALANHPDTDVTLKAKDGTTVLSRAAKSGDPETLRTLIQSRHGAKIKAQIDDVIDGRTALLEAAADGRPPDAILAVLEAQPKKIDLKDPDGFTALMLASHSANAKGVKALLRAGADVTIQQTPGGQTALDLAKDRLRFASDENDQKALKNEIIPALEQAMKQAQTKVKK